MVTIGETRMWHDITSIARSLHRIAEAVEKAMTEPEEPEKDDLPLTRIAWKSEVAHDKTDQGFDDWLSGRRGD